jgi:hypothetical protein
VRLAKATSSSSVQIDAQACTDEMCAMVEALMVPVDSETDGQGSVDPESLVVVADDVDQ